MTQGQIHFTTESNYLNSLKTVGAWAKIADNMSLTERKGEGGELDPRIIANLASAVGNSEVKALLFLSMEEGIIYSQADLQKAFWDIQGTTRKRRSVDDTIGWPINGLSLFHYCEHSFVPIGLVAKEVYEPGSLDTYGFLKTDFGVKVGVPFAASLLDFSQKYPQHSLLDLLGYAGSSMEIQEIETPEGIGEYRKRSAGIRIELFKHLLSFSELPIRTKDVIDKLDVTGVTVTKHLMQLGQRGIINYRSIRHDQNYCTFRLPAAQPDVPFQRLKRRARTYEYGIDIMTAVHSFFMENKGVDFNLDQVQVRFPKYTRQTLNLILFDLSKTGHIEYLDFRKGTLSEVSLTIEQRKFLQEFVSIIDSFQTSDPTIIEYGKQKAREILRDKQKVAELAEKAKSRSSFASRQKELGNNIITLLSENPDQSSREISLRLKEMGINVEAKRAGQILNNLNSLGIVVFVEHGQMRRWRLSRLYNK